MFQFQKTSRVFSLLFWASVLLREINLIIIGVTPYMNIAVLVFMFLFFVGMLDAWRSGASKEDLFKDLVAGLKPALDILTAFSKITSSTKKDR